ncbi:MAG: hypothetical protein V4657_12455 [Pseudomonadota bacterium]
MAQFFAGKALAISAMYGGPYYDALVHSPGEAVYDDGGSIITPGDATVRTCQAQVDSVTQDMRREEGFVDGDVRILVLATTLSGAITTDDQIEILGGANVGRFMVQSVSRDPFGVYYELRGRPA